MTEAIVAPSLAALADALPEARPLDLTAAVDPDQPRAEPTAPILAWSATVATAGLLVGAGAAEWVARDAAESYDRAHRRFALAVDEPDGRAAALDARRAALAARDRFETAASWRTGLLLAALGTGGAATWAWIDHQTINLSPMAGGVAVAGSW